MLYMVSNFGENYEDYYVSNNSAHNIPLYRPTIYGHMPWSEVNVKFSPEQNTSVVWFVEHSCAFILLGVVRPI